MFDELDVDIEEIQSAVENIDNVAKKNNIRLHGVKEGIEGSELQQFLEEIFTSCLGAEAQVEIRISSAYCLGILKKTQKNPQDILIKFPNWPMKQAALNIFKETPGLEIEGVQLLAYPDFSKITIRKQKNLRFLTTILTQRGVPYRWGFHLN